MSKNGRPLGRMQNVFVFLLLAVFAISAIFLTALGAQVYRDTVDVSGRNNEARITASLIRGAAQAEDSGTASVRVENGIEVLIFENDYDGEIYCRRFFCADGYLRESFASAEYEFEPEMGEPLIEVSAFGPRIEDGMLTVRITAPDGVTQEVYACLRAGGAAE